MAPFFYMVSSFAIVLIYFKTQTRVLHSLETFAYWLFGSMLVQNYFALMVLNFNRFVIPDVFSLELASLVERTVLEPVILLWFLSCYVRAKSFHSKTGLLLAFLLLLVGLEWLDDAFGVRIHQHWRLWWSFAAWFLILMASLGFKMLFRYRLRREVDHS